jgi:pimeloyl-ACP methyl ester carboxylesterase
MIQDTPPWRPKPADTLCVNGHRCHVIDRGQGQPIVILHGLGSMAREIAWPLRSLRRDYRVIVPDRPGYGATDSLRRRSDLRPDEQAVWLRDLLQQLGVVRPILVAHSIGAAVALTYALRYPRDVAGLVLIAPFCRPTRPAFMPLMRLALLPWIGRAMRERVFPLLADCFGPSRLAAAFAPNAVPDYMQAMPLRPLVQPETLLTMAAELFGFNPAMTASRHALRHLDVPTAILAGDSDKVAETDRHAAWLARRLPHAHLLRLPKVGHMAQHVRPDAVIRAIDAVVHATSPNGKNFYHESGLPDRRDSPFR